MIHTKKTKSSLSEKRKGERNPFYGKKHTPEVREILATNLRTYSANRTYDLAEAKLKIPVGNDLFYLAGMIDADGSIRFRKKRPFVAVYNTSVPLMNWLVNTIGGSYIGGDKRGREVSNTWCISAARDVHNLCTALLPVLKIKAEDAQAAITHLKEKYGERI